MASMAVQALQLKAFLLPSAQDCWVLVSRLHFLSCRNLPAMSRLQSLDWRRDARRGSASSPKERDRAERLSLT